MIVTEKEAATKRCQESFPAHGAFADIMMDREVVEAPRHCIGSACMAWRWHAWTEYLKGDIGENDFVATPLVSATHGYCGKAGRQLAVGKLGEAE